VNVSYALPLGQIAGDLGDSVKDLRVEVGVSMNAADGRVLASGLDTLSLTILPGRSGSFVELYRVFCSSGFRQDRHACPSTRF